MKSKRHPGVVLIVLGALFLVGSLGNLLVTLGLIDGENYGLGTIVLGAAIGGVMLYAGLKRRAGAPTTAASVHSAEDSPRALGELGRLTDHALDAAEGLGVDVSSARKTLHTGDVDESATHLSVGGGEDENPLLVAKMVGSTVNVRFWRMRGAPDFEVDLNVETGEITYAKRDGERLV